MPDPQNIKYRSELHLLLPPNFVSCEVGVAEGYFSADILSWGASLHYMVDAWKHFEGQTGDGGFNQAWHDNNYAAACARVAKYDGKVKILRGASVEMASEIPDNSLDLCYVDAWHTYDGALRDARAYWPKLKEGGIMAFHDYLNEAYGVHRAVNDWAREKRVHVNVIPEDHEPDAGAWIRKPLRQANPQPRQAQTQGENPLVGGFYRWQYTGQHGENHRSRLGEQVFPNINLGPDHLDLLHRLRERVRARIMDTTLRTYPHILSDEVRDIRGSGFNQLVCNEIERRLQGEINLAWRESGRTTTRRQQINLTQEAVNAAVRGVERATRSPRPPRDGRLLSSAEFMTYARLLTRVKDRLRSQFSSAPQLPIEVALTATEVSLIELSGHSPAAKDEIIKRLTEEIPRFWAELGGAPEMPF
jgi:hypothetical protein